MKIFSRPLLTISEVAPLDPHFTAPQRMKMRDAERDVLVYLHKHSDNKTWRLITDDPKYQASMSRLQLEKWVGRFNDPPLAVIVGCGTLIGAWALFALHQNGPGWNLALQYCVAAAAVTLVVVQEGDRAARAGRREIAELRLCELVVETFGEIEREIGIF